MRWWLALTILASILPAGAVYADAGDGPDIVVLPLANLSGRHEALVGITPLLESELQRHGHTVMGSAEVRTLLRARRIRSMGRIGLRDARVVAEETGARYALLGSIDLYRPETSLEVAVSARILDLRSMRLVGAASASRTVQGSEGWFAIGRADSIAEFLPDVVGELTDRLHEILARAAEVSPDHTSGIVAFVQLDNHSGRMYGTEVLLHQLLGVWIERGIPTVEPGFVDEVLLGAQLVARGGIAKPALDLLRRELEIEWILTGELETFDFTPSGTEAAVPFLAFGLRLVDAERHRLVSSFDLERDGLRGQRLFQRGREHSTVGLARSCAEEAVRWFVEETRP
jgi:TolB-like protein